MTAPLKASSPPSARRALWVILTLFVLVRIVLLARSPLHMFQGEEYLHLRLVRQWMSDHPVGALSQYAYGDARGLTFGGSVVLSLLYFVVAPVFGTGYAAVKVMALAWATLGFLAVTALSRRSFGPWAGVAAGVALLCMPPGWVVYSSVAWGNHFEGGVLVTLMLLCFSIAAEEEGVRADRAAGALGLLLLFTPWFWFPGVAMTLLLALPAATMIRRARARKALLGGLVLGAIPWLLIRFKQQVFGPDALVPPLDQLVAGELQSAGGPLGLALRALRSVPAYDVAWFGRWRLPEPWLGGADVVFVAVGWSALLLLCVGSIGAQIRARGVPTSPRDAVVLCAALFALALPLCLALSGAAIPRRVTPVGLLFAFALAAPLRQLLRPGSSRVPRLVGVVALVGIGLLPTALLALSGPPPPPQGTSAARFALCPAEVPLYEAGGCITQVTDDSLRLLLALDQDPKLDWPTLKAVALRGFDDGWASGAESVLHQMAPGCPPPSVRPRSSPLGLDHEIAAWRAFGMALQASCGDEAGRLRCAVADSPELLGACTAGLREAASILR
jgi:hypothetical protein